MIELNNVINRSILLRLAVDFKSRKKAELEILEPQKTLNKDHQSTWVPIDWRLRKKNLALNLWRHPINSDVSPKMHRLKQLGL